MTYTHSQSRLSLHLLTFLIGVILRAYTLTAFVINANDVTTTDTLPYQQLRHSQQMTTKPLPSRILLQSPRLENVYKDYVVTSKPLTLRKYKNGQKVKKTKKDSKIYFIPIPPMPYRYIPGVGYDYQPMQIRPILPETPLATASPVHKPSHAGYGLRPMQKPHKNFKPNNSIDRISSSGDSKLIRLQHNDYYFNGRPIRLLVAHADHKQQLTPLNLKSRFYFNKNIIY